MSEKPLPKINTTYRTPDGFTKWNPNFKTLVVMHPNPGETDIVFTQANVPAICFTLTDAQRDELVGLLLGEAPGNPPAAGVAVCQPTAQGVA